MAVWNIVLQTSYISASALIVSSLAHIHLGRVRVSSVQLFWGAGAAAMVPGRKIPLLIVPSQRGGAERAKVKGAKTRGHPGFACVATKEMQSGGRNRYRQSLGWRDAFHKCCPRGPHCLGTRDVCGQPFLSSLGWCICFWISSLCWENIHPSKQGHGKVVSCSRGLSSFIALNK